MERVGGGRDTTVREREGGPEIERQRTKDRTGQKEGRKKGGMEARRCKGGRKPERYEGREERNETLRKEGKKGRKRGRN